MLILQVLLCLLLVYLIFCFFPAVVMFRSIFYRCGEKVQQKMHQRKAYYLPFVPLLDRANALLDSLPTQEVWLEAHDSVRLCAEYHDGGFDKTAVLFHGYRSTPRSNCAYLASLLWERGYNLLLPYQRAHGKSGGAHSTMGFLEQQDVLLWLDWAAQKESVSTVLPCGISMGATSIAFAADRLPQTSVPAMVLDCGFTSIHQQLTEDAKKLHIPPWTVLPPLDLFFRLRFGASIRDSVEASLSKASIPALFLHGKNDNSVTFSQGQRNFTACASEKEAIFLPDAAHTCVLLQGGEDAQNKLFAFLDRHIPAQSETT